MNDELINASIYLDQNILSDLRARKLEESNDENLILLKKVLLSFNIQVVYSHITLVEINQITSDKYKLEHIDVLEELNAKYIEPKSKKISDKKPSQVWINYIENIDSEDDILDTKSLALIFENLSRKLSGLPIESSLEEIGLSLEDSMKNISQICIEQLNIINENDFEEPFKSIIMQMKEQIPILLKSPQKFDIFSKFDNQPLGPKPFREYTPIKRLNISELPSSIVVSAIESVYNHDNTFNWRASFDDSIENRITMAYSLMNWAGYYPDDFDKIKKNHDRYRASNNDMQHAAIASRTTFLISNDNAFCMKAIASYEYAGVDTIVCSLYDFLEKYCTE
ncbi:MAG: hypothetical protein Q7T91_03125 [Sulfuricurvum sp.]|nr:hypothetical protein [Sulfuricurvum sp.]